MAGEDEGGVYWDDSTTSASANVFDRYTSGISERRRRRRSVYGGCGNNGVDDSIYQAFIKITGNKKKKKNNGEEWNRWRLVPLDMTRMTQMWMYATHRDTTVIECIRVLTRETMKEGMNIRFHNEDSLEKLDSIVEMCKNAVVDASRRRRRRRRKMDDVKIVLPEQRMDALNETLMLESTTAEARENTVRIANERAASLQDDDDDDDDDDTFITDVKEEEDAKAAVENEKEMLKTVERMEALVNKALSMPSSSRKRQRREQTMASKRNVMNVTDDYVEQMKLVAEKAIRWRHVFGFVPIAVYSEQGKTRVSVPEFGTLRFALLIDMVSMTSSVVALASEAEKKLRQDDDDDDDDDDGMSISRLVRVFTWPGREPSLDGRLFSTTVATLMLEWTTLTAHANFNRRGHEFSSYPPFIVAAPQSRAPQSLDRADDKTYYANVGLVNQLTDGAASEMLPEEMQYYRRNSSRLLQQEAMEEMAQRSMVDNEHSYTTYSDGTGRLYSGVSMPPHLGNRLQLAEGGTVQHAQMPSTHLSEVQQMKTSYQMTVCNTFGLPGLFVLDRNTPLRGMRSTTVDSSNAMLVMRMTVENEQRELAKLIEFVYELLFRSDDDETLVGLVLSCEAVMQELHRRLEEDAVAAVSGSLVMHSVAQQTAQAQRVLRDELLRLRPLIARNFRTEVVFPRKHITQAMTMENLIQMRHERSISASEWMTFMRALVDCEPVSDDSTLMRERALLEKLEFHNKLGKSSSSSSVDESPTAEEHEEEEEEYVKKT